MKHILSVWLHVYTGNSLQNWNLEIEFEKENSKLEWPPFFKNFYFIFCRNHKTKTQDKNGMRQYNVLYPNLPWHSHRMVAFELVFICTSNPIRRLLTDGVIIITWSKFNFKRCFVWPLQHSPFGLAIKSRYPAMIANFVCTIKILWNYTEESVSRCNDGFWKTDISPKKIGSFFKFKFKKKKEKKSRMKSTSWICLCYVFHCAN